MAVERVTAEQFKTILTEVSAAVSGEKDRLTELDSVIGDGDHGFGMANGFRVGTEEAAQKPEAAIEEQLKTLGFALIREVGGASGTIFGSFFLGMAKAAKGKEDAGLSDFGDMFAEGLTLVQLRGKAEPGDKTMIDAIHPALSSLRQSSAEGLSLIEGFKIAATAAWDGAEKTKLMIGKHGRAKYFREKSVGFQDAGATTMAIVIGSISRTLESLAS
jgi:phosphoenolpyruvate---glycerone phosphotransferase subunit DhaL